MRGCSHVVFLCACDIIGSNHSSVVLTHRKQFLPLVIQISNSVCHSLLTSGTVAERKRKMVVNNNDNKLNTKVRTLSQECEHYHATKQYTKTDDGFAAPLERSLALHPLTILLLLQPFKKIVTKQMINSNKPVKAQSHIRDV